MPDRINGESLRSNRESFSSGNNCSRPRKSLSSYGSVDEQGGDGGKSEIWIVVDVNRDGVDRIVRRPSSTR